MDEHSGDPLTSTDDNLERSSNEKNIEHSERLNDSSNFEEELKGLEISGLEKVKPHLRYNKGGKYSITVYNNIGYVAKGDVHNDVKAQNIAYDNASLTATGSSTFIPRQIKNTEYPQIEHFDQNKRSLPCLDEAPEQKQQNVPTQSEPKNKTVMKCTKQDSVKINKSGTRVSTQSKDDKSATGDVNNAVTSHNVALDNSSLNATGGSTFMPRQIKNTEYPQIDYCEQNKIALPCLDEAPKKKQKNVPPQSEPKNKTVIKCTKQDSVNINKSGTRVSTQSKDDKSATDQDKSLHRKTSESLKTTKKSTSLSDLVDQSSHVHKEHAPTFTYELNAKKSLSMPNNFGFSTRKGDVNNAVTSHNVALDNSSLNATGGSTFMPRQLKNTEYPQIDYCEQNKIALPCLDEAQKKKQKNVPTQSEPKNKTVIKCTKQDSVNINKSGTRVSTQSKDDKSATAQDKSLHRKTSESLKTTKKSTRFSDLVDQSSQVHKEYAPKFPYELHAEKSLSMPNIFCSSTRKGKGSSRYATEFEESEDLYNITENQLFLISSFDKNFLNPYSQAIQEETFTKWVNSHLERVALRIQDLYMDLGKGKNLLKLLEVVSGEKLPEPTRGRMRINCLENATKALQFLKDKQVNLGNMGPHDIVDGNHRLILDLIWTIILRFQIQNISVETADNRGTKSAKDALLFWCQMKTSGYWNVNVQNFTTSWRDGLAFNAIIHTHSPELIEYGKLKEENAIENLQNAFNVAEQKLGITKLLDALDVAVNHPDEKSIITYVATYYHYFAKISDIAVIGNTIGKQSRFLMSSRDASESERSKDLSNITENPQFQHLRSSKKSRYSFQDKKEALVEKSKTTGSEYTDIRSKPISNIQTQGYVEEKARLEVATSGNSTRHRPADTPPPAMKTMSNPREDRACIIL
uniref:uncharacterized protein LOC120340368 n=1 Tax=Styela clava TaxID=7725 RepID=UPI0019399FB9|nr:uncharacterized protein LOC120340368 [Styela clava]